MKKKIEYYFNKYKNKPLKLIGSPWSHIYGNDVWKFSHLDGEVLYITYPKNYMDEYGYSYPREVDTWKSDDNVKIDYFPYGKLVVNQLRQMKIKILNKTEYNSVRISKIIDFLNKKCPTKDIKERV